MMARQADQSSLWSHKKSLWISMLVSVLLGQELKRTTYTITEIEKNCFYRLFLVDHASDLFWYTQPDLFWCEDEQLWGACSR